MANPYFNATYYLSNNPDVFAAGINTVEGAWTHYVNHGAGEALSGAASRSPAPWFDISYYLTNNPDLSVAGLTAGQLFDHFVNHGISEGRLPSADANVNKASLDAYAAANEDLRDAFGIEEGEEITEAQYAQLAQHYYQFGYYETRPGKPNESASGETGQTFWLTEGTDRGPDFTGTAGDDEFLAYAHQNPYVGGIGNTLSSADHLDGGAGYDSLFAEIVPEYFGGNGILQVDIQPRTTSIEQVEFEVRDAGGWFAGDPSYDFDYDEGFGIVATVDAKHMYGVERIGSKQSDGDLIIENLTTLASDGVTKRNTSELTITMDHTDNTNSDGDPSDLIVLFDDNYLLAGQESEGKAFYWLLDEEADMVGGPLLDHIDVDGIRFRIGDSEIINLESDAAFEADTHEEFVAALQVQLTELIADGVVPAGTTLSLSYDDSKVITLDNGTPSSPIPAIVLISGDGSPVEPVGFSRVEDAIGEYSVHGSFTNEFEIEDQPVSVNVELTKVGRGGDGGDLIIGGKSGHQGIEEFNVTVMGGEHLPNSLGVLGTTGGDLDTVNIVSDVLLGQETFASLEIREGFGQASLNRVDASGFLGDLYLGTSFSVQNLSTLVATGGGDVVFFGDITDLNHSDPFAATGNYSYTTGAGDDLIDVDVDGDAVDTVGTSLTINTGAGDDVVSVELNDGVSQATMYLLGNLNINTGEGDDAVFVHGIGNFDIVTGAGNDLVVIDDEVDWLSGTAESGEWEVGAATGVQPFADRVLYEAELTVMFAGFESKVKVNTTAANNFVATQMDINNAIEQAIAGSPELSELLEVERGTGGQQLLISSNPVGVNDFAISLYQPTLIAAAPAAAGEIVVTSSTVLNSIKQGLIDTTALDSTAFPVNDADAIRTQLNNLAGSLDDEGGVAVPGTGGLGENLTGTYQFLTPQDGNSANNDTANEVNYSTIDVGAGTNDIIVLGSNNESANTIVINKGFDGKVSVVNFFVDEDGAGTFTYGSDDDVGTDTADVGLHALDFTAFLTNQISTSGSPESRVDAAVVLSGDSIGSAVAQANSVTILQYDGLAANSLSFDAFTMANLVAALNGDAGSTVVGGLGDADLDAIATPDLVGNLQHHIVLVHNEQNHGEYKAFHLTSTVDSSSGTVVDGDVAAGSYIGKLDFGYELVVGAHGDLTSASSAADFLAAGGGNFTEINLVGSVANDAFIDNVILA